MGINYYNKHLKECKWSKDPKKKYKQLGHYLYNIEKYNLKFPDILSLQSERNDLYKIINKK